MSTKVVEGVLFMFTVMHVRWIEIKIVSVEIWGRVPRGVQKRGSPDPPCCRLLNH